MPLMLGDVVQVEDIVLTIEADRIIEPHVDSTAPTMPMFTGASLQIDIVWVDSAALDAST